MENRLNEGTECNRRSRINTSNGRKHKRRYVIWVNVLNTNEESKLSFVIFGKLGRGSSVRESERSRGQFGKREKRRSALIKSKERISALHDNIVSVSAH